MLRLRNIEYLHEQQWHQESDEYSNSDIKKRFEMYDIYKYRWDIHSICDEATESDYDDEHSKYDENDETKALNDEHIHR